MNIIKSIKKEFPKLEFELIYKDIKINYRSKLSAIEINQNSGIYTVNELNGGIFWRSKIIECPFIKIGHKEIKLKYADGKRLKFIDKEIIINKIKTIDNYP